MELNTIAECDVALHCFDMLKGEHRREYDEATKQSHEFTQKANLAWSQLNITNDRIREVEQRKKELCDIKAKESHLINVNSSQLNSVKYVEDALEETQTFTSADLRPTLSD